MVIPQREEFSWEGAAEGWQRLGEANDQAHRQWLRQLTEEESIAILEDLCKGVPGRGPTPDVDPPPVVLFRIWQST